MKRLKARLPDSSFSSGKDQKRSLPSSQKRSAAGLICRTASGPRSQQFTNKSDCGVSHSSLDSNKVALCHDALNGDWGVCVAKRLECGVFQHRFAVAAGRTERLNVASTGGVFGSGAEDARTPNAGARCARVQDSRLLDFATNRIFQNHCVSSHAADGDRPRSQGMLPCGLM